MQSNTNKDIFDEIVNTISIDPDIQKPAVFDLDGIESNLEAVSDEELQMEAYVDLINVSFTYYKGLFNKANENPFSNIDYEDLSSTNRYQELFNEAIYIHKKLELKDKNLVEIYDPKSIDYKDHDEIYGLIIDDKIMKVSPSIFTIFKYVSDLEWNKINWKITKLYEKME
jgi:hypothetical protein